MIHLVNVDLRAAVTALAPYLDRPVSFGGIPSVRVTLETPHPVPRSSIAALARGLVEGQNLVLIADSAGDMYRVEPKPPPPVKASPSQGEGADATAQSSAPQFFVIHLHHARAAMSQQRSMRCTGARVPLASRACGVAAV